VALPLRVHRPPFVVNPEQEGTTPWCNPWAFVHTGRPLTGSTAFATPSVSASLLAFELDFKIAPQCHLPLAADELVLAGGPCESRSRHLGIKRAFPDFAVGPLESQRVLLSQVNRGECEDGRDGPPRPATQRDGIVGSIVGQNSPRCHRRPHIAMTRVKASPTGTCGLPKLPVEPLDNRQYRAA